VRVYKRCAMIFPWNGWRACVEKSWQASTREPADAHLQGDGPLDPSLLNGQRMDCV
jgi:hypothetical protein